MPSFRCFPFWLLSTLLIIAPGGAVGLREQPVFAAEPAPIDIGYRRELFVDGALLESRAGVELRLHHPTPREVALVHDAPWEGTGCGYHTIFRDGEIVRMYYIAGELTADDRPRIPSRPYYVCYAESRDGLRWTKPGLGLFAHEGSKQNNIVWAAPALDNISVFKDPNPACRAGEEYKAVSSGKGGLFALKSSDGIHWSRISETPIIIKGAFDTQNIAFWDSGRKHYWCYVRDFHSGIRDIRVSTSPDFVTWSEPELLKYADSPDEQLYTNQILPYYRAPHIFVGFPTRYVERAWSPAFSALPDPKRREERMKLHPRYGTAITDGLFMSSRDGRLFRRWGEAFIRPGIERRNNWLYGDGYQSWGLLETAAEDPLAPPELSVHVIEDNWKRATRLRRYTLRADGFVSLNAPLKGGEVVSKPLTFSGERLSLNFSTSAAGSVRIELQDSGGKPFPGFGLADCDEVFGDALERSVTWKGSADVASLAGKSVRVRLVLRDADVYAMQFRHAE